MKVDMSAKAIDRRLRATSDLRDLCLRLQGLGAEIPMPELKESFSEYEVRSAKPSENG